MSNKNDIKSSLQNLFSQGLNKVHVLADFDGTLTKEYINGKRTPSLISILRDHPGYLSPKYQLKAHELYNKYHPIERDLSLSLAYRKEKMVEWWTISKQLLIDSGLKKEHLEQIAQSQLIEWRPGAIEFLKLMEKQQIPVVIMSASGIGESIPMFCEKNGLKSSNIHYIINRFIWDKYGNAIDFQRPIIHTLNKDETIIKNYDNIFSAIKKRRNVLLLGNNGGDAGMIKGFNAQKVLSFGFLDNEDQNYAAEFKKFFDYVIIEDGFTFIQKYLSQIL